MNWIDWIILFWVYFEKRIIFVMVIIINVIVDVSVFGLNFCRFIEVKLKLK